MPRKLPEALKKHQFVKKESKKSAPKPRAKAKKTEAGFARQGPGPQVRV